MMGQFLLLFNVGIYLARVLPGLLLGLPYPAAPIPYAAFLADDGGLPAHCQCPLVACGPGCG